MMRDGSYQGRQMGLSIVDRQADNGFWFYLQSLHGVESLTADIFKVTKGQKHTVLKTDGEAVFLITSVPPWPDNEDRHRGADEGHRTGVASWLSHLL